MCAELFQENSHRFKWRQ